MTSSWRRQRLFRKLPRRGKVAALAGFFLAVCSCTVVPLFAGIYRRGGGLGAAITFLFFAPAANILAISYTGVAIGMDLVIARILLSLVFGIGVGMIMALIYGRDEAIRNGGESEAFGGAKKVPAKIVSYDIVTTPGLVINEKVVSSGRIPSKAEVTTWVANALAQDSS